MELEQKGKFIVIEGGEGSGTTTVAKELVKQFGWSAIYTREPGGSPYAEKIRELVLSDEAKQSDAETQFALFWAARRDHIQNTIVPALLNGKIVICDRFDSSTYAYQIIAQERTDLVDVFWKIREAFLGEHTPDAYILLNVTPETGVARAMSRGTNVNYFDKKKIEFHKRVNAGLLDFVSNHIDNGHVVSAEQPLEKVIRDTTDIIDKIVK